MADLLIHHAALNRLHDRLPDAEGLRTVAMSETGTFLDPSGAPVTDVAPEFAYGSTDVWFDPQAQTFVKAVLETPRLAWFQAVAAGIEHPVLAAIGRKAEIYCTCHVQAEAIAEWAVWAALDALRNGPTHRANQAAGAWVRQTSREIAGSRWLVVGFGAIGQAVGRRVQALGGHVTGVRRSGGSAPGADTMLTALTAEALSAADVILLSLPHTPETESIANADFFAAMAPDSVFLNLGRGALVDEAALLAGLDGGRPGWAALDVVREEPLPADSPLWRHPRLMITPHDSAATPGTVARADALFLENLQAFLRGRPLRHVADRSLFDPAI